MKIRDWTLDPFVALYSVGAGQFLCMMKQLMERMQPPQQQKRLCDASDDQLHAMKIARKGYEEAGKMKEIAARKLAQAPNETVMKMAAEQMLSDLQKDDNEKTRQLLADIAQAIPHEVQARVLTQNWKDIKTTIIESEHPYRTMSFPRKVLEMAARQILNDCREKYLNILDTPGFSAFRNVVMEHARKAAKAELAQELQWEKQRLREVMEAKFQKAGVALETDSESEQAEEEEEEEEVSDSDSASIVALDIDEV